MSKGNKKAFIPDPHNTAKTKLPPSPKTNSTDKLSFNFSYFKQSKWFGLKGTNSAWFISVLEQLKQMSTIPISEFLSSQKFKNNLRWHRINYQNKNCPYKSQAELLEEVKFPKESLAQEIEVVQFQISKANGRVVGIRLDCIFYVFHFDRYHNLQPSKNENYTLDPTQLCNNEYQEMRSLIDKIKRLLEQDKINDIKNLISKKQPQDGIYYTPISSELCGDIIEKIFKQNPDLERNIDMLMLEAIMQFAELGCKTQEQLATTSDTLN